MAQNCSPTMIPSLERATHAVAVYLGAALREEGMTQAEAHILGYLAEVKGCSINDLHRDFGHRRSTLTSVLDRLESRGLVRRGPHATSRRSVMVHLTERGQPVEEQVVAVLEAMEAVVRARLSEADIDAFYRVLEAIEEITP